jgi:TPR repeat protein
MRIYRTAAVAVLPLLFSATSWSADFAIGQDAYECGDYQTALTEWQPLAEEGRADGQFGMGLLYANGFGVPSDNDQALKWYQLAAENGHADAQYNLAVMHANGWGVPISDENAFKWYSLAAEHGLPQAQVSLAKMYTRGFGAPKDNVQAYKWLAVAAELGETRAGFKRDELSGKMSAEEISESDRLASVWMENYQNLLASE